VIDDTANCRGVKRAPCSTFVGALLSKLDYGMYLVATGRDKALLMQKWMVPFKRFLWEDSVFQRAANSPLQPETAKRHESASW